MRLLPLLLVASAAFGQDYPTVENVQYCTGGAKPLMDVFVPNIPVRKPTPAVLWLHGGGWKRGDKNGSSGALLLVGAGFVTASIYYRLSGDSKFPAQIEDAKCAIRYLRSHGRGLRHRSRFDRHRRSVVGGASGAAGWHHWPRGGLRRLGRLGGHLQPGAGRFLVLRADGFFGLHDGVRRARAQHDQEAAGRAAGEPAYKRASPISYVTPNMAPVLMFHGDSDHLVPHSQSERMPAALQHAGVEARLITVGNADHDFAPFVNDKLLSIAEAEIHGTTIAFRKWLLPAAAK